MADFPLSATTRRATRALVAVAEDKSLSRESVSAVWLSQSESSDAQSYLEKSADAGRVASIPRARIPRGRLQPYVFVLRQKRTGEGTGIGTMHDKSWGRGGTLLVISLIAADVSAHHSSSGYDMGKSITVTGVVTKIDWFNPHVYLYVEETTIEAAKPFGKSKEGFPPALFSNT